MAEYYPGAIEKAIAEITNKLKVEMASRGTRGATILYNKTQKVLSGSRGGRIYRIPHEAKYYVASAPGEPPANRMGTFRSSFHPDVESDGNSVRMMAKSSYSVNGYNLGHLLEDGTRKMAARPYKDKVIEQSKGELKELFSRPYF